MNKRNATRIFESLSSDIRLDAYRLLVKHGRTGMVAGQIAEELDLPPANMSFHLKALAQSGLVTVEQEGRFQRYRANFALMTELIAYLTAECCVADAGQCCVTPARPRARGSSVKVPSR